MGGSRLVVGLDKQVVMKKTSLGKLNKTRGGYEQGCIPNKIHLSLTILVNVVHYT